MINVIKNEVYKLLARKKIYILMSILFIVSVFSLVSAAITNSIFKPATPNGNAAIQGQLISSLGRYNGQSFPLTLIGGMIGIILPVFVVILVANLVTDEYADGSLKLSLLRQVSRNQLLISKLASLAIVIALFLLLLLVVGYGLGTAFFGWGDRFLLKGKVLTSGQGFIFTLLIYVTSLLSLISFGIVILFFAVIFDNSGSVVGVGMGIMFTSLFIEQIFPEVSPYLISNYFSTYNLFISHAGVKEIALGLLIVLAYGAVFYTLSSFIFRRKDLLI